MLCSVSASYFGVMAITVKRECICASPLSTSVCFYGLLKSIHRAALSTLLLSVYDDDGAYIQEAVIGRALLYSPTLLPGFIV